MHLPKTDDTNHSANNFANVYSGYVVCRPGIASFWFTTAFVFPGVFVAVSEAAFSVGVTAAIWRLVNISIALAAGALREARSAMESPQAERSSADLLEQAGGRSRAGRRVRVGRDFLCARDWRT